MKDPSNNINYPNNHLFNITVFFNDTVKGASGEGIDGIPSQIISANGTSPTYYKNSTLGYYFIEYNWTVGKHCLYFLSEIDHETHVYRTYNFYMSLRIIWKMAVSLLNFRF